MASFILLPAGGGKQGIVSKLWSLLFCVNTILLVPGHDLLSVAAELGSCGRDYVA